MAEEQLTAPVETAPAAVEAPVAPAPEVPAEPPAPPTVEELAKKLEETQKQYEERIKRMEDKFSRRIGSVVAKKNELRDRLFAIEGSNISQQTFKEPTLAEFNGNAEQFIKARDNHISQVTAHEQAKQSFEQQRIAADVGEAVETLREAMEETLSAEERDLVNKSTAPSTPSMLKYMAQVPEGTKLAVHLAKYPKDAEFIAGLPAPDQAGALLHLTNAIRTGFAAPQKPAAAAPLAAAAPAAPPPPPPSGRGGSAPRTSASAQSHDEYLAARKKEYNAYRFKR